MNPNIILQGSQPNFVNALAQGTQAATQVNANQRVQQQNQLFQQHGVGIANGDPNAINALAQFDPNQAIGVNQAQQGMRQTQQNMDFSTEKMEMLRAETKRQSAEYAAGLSAADAAAQRAKISEGLQGAGHFYSTGDEAGYNAFLQQRGLDPVQYPFAAFPAHAARFEGAMDALSDHEERAKGPVPLSGLGKVQFDINSGALPEGTPLRNPPASTNVNVNTGGNTKGWEAIDKNFATEVYVPWRVQGGSADSGKLIAQLGQASGALASGAELTGPATGMIPDIVQAWVNPEAIAVRERVEEVVQRNLREVLGAQFTEKEGVRLIARAYNPRLEEGENKRRVDALIRQMQAAANAKNAAVAYFSQHGTLRGFEGALMTKRDFEFPDWEDSGLTEIPQTATPGTGTVVDGYQFNGGDPADQNNWTQVQ